MNKNSEQFLRKKIRRGNTKKEKRENFKKKKETNKAVITRKLIGIDWKKEDWKHYERKKDKK